VKSFTLATENSKPRWSREPTVVLDVGSGEAPAEQPRPDSRARQARARLICVVADLSAGSAEPLPAAVPVDRDGLDRLVSCFAPRLRLDLPFCREIVFEGWGDFHPDSLLERVPGLAELSEARRSVGDTARMQGALARAGVDLEAAPAPAPGAGPVSGAESPRAARPSRSFATDHDLLDSMLGSAGASDAGADGFERAIRKIVSSSGDAGDHARQDRWREVIDAERSKRLRALLGHPAFRRLEASWLGLRGLVRALPEDGVRIVVLDLSQSRFGAELEHGGSSLERMLDDQAEREEGEPAWDLLVSDFEFDAGAASRDEIRHLLDLAARLQRPILVGAAGSAAAIEAASEDDLAAWSALQQHPGAQWLGLCAPRLLMRLPYGERGEPLAEEGFDEHPRPGCREDYTWGSAAFAVAKAIAEAWTRDAGAQSVVAAGCELESLPLYVALDAAGEPHAVGPVEERLGATRLEAFEWMGITPIAALPGRDAARLPGLRSLARAPLRVP
jgi:type VI secretion system protein ImpC